MFRGEAPEDLGEHLFLAGDENEGPIKIELLRRPPLPGEKTRVCAVTLSLSTAIMSSFIAVKLDKTTGKTDNSLMTAAQQQTSHPRNVTSTVRQRIEASGERVWRMADFSGLSFPPLPRPYLASPARGNFADSGRGFTTDHAKRPSGRACRTRPLILDLPLRQCAVFPVGVAAANMLGFTTQNPARIELATDGLSLPRLIVGKEAVIHTRRPPAWKTQPQHAALLDFLRNRGAASELTPTETVRKLLGTPPRSGTV